MNSLALFSRTVHDFSGINSALKTGTDLEVAAHCDLTLLILTDDARALIYAAAFSGLDTSDPGHVLRHMPQQCLSSISYTFFIVCDLETYKDINTTMRASVYATIYDEYAVVLASGSLGDWKETLLLYLNKHIEISFGYRVILNKLYKFLERQGLKALFTGHRVQNLPDHTFYLEG